MTVSQLRLVVEAADYDQAVAFYRDVLGLKEEAAFEGPGDAHVTILDAGRATLELANPAQHRYIDDVEVGRPTAGHVRVAFEVGDSAAVTDRLANAGAALVAPPTRTPWESLNSRLDAPAGLQITVFQELAEPALAPDYPVETERLLLRPIDPERDVDAMHAYLSREDVCAYIPPTPGTREQIAERLARPERTRSVLTKEGQVLALAVVLKETGTLIGDVVLFWHSAQHRSGEIGYAFNPDYHGKGYATEAAEALLRLAFDGLGLRRVTARIDQENPASAAVVRKLGMRQEAVLVENEWFKGRWSTEMDFAILDREWRARHGNEPDGPAPS
jgi:RimJ/RimL family protein N-acetyltransferase/predicted enzyme related to lactoylglutathione lyase